MCAAAGRRSGDCAFPAAAAGASRPTSGSTAGLGGKGGRRPSLAQGGTGTSPRRRGGAGSGRPGGCAEGAHVTLGIAIFRAGRAVSACCSCPLLLRLLPLGKARRLPQCSACRPEPSETLQAAASHRRLFLPRRRHSAAGRDGTPHTAGDQRRRVGGGGDGSAVQPEYGGTACGRGRAGADFPIPAPERLAPPDWLRLEALAAGEHSAPPFSRWWCHNTDPTRRSCRSKRCRHT